MGYRHILNFYKDQNILMFKECYALEKVHGTSAHIKYKDDRIMYFAGGVKHSDFLSLFDEAKLRECFVEMGVDKNRPVTLFGEAYGGKCQAQSYRYGKELRFIVFEVQIGDSVLNVSDAAKVTKRFGLEFVPYARIFTTLEAIDAERDRPSIVAEWRGCGEQPREGVVLRPIIEMRSNNGQIISKHKRDDERETKSKRKVVDADKLQILEKADEIAEEWVTETRLSHVLDKIDGVIGIERTGDVTKAMIEDVTREAKGEIIESKEAKRAIGKRAARMFKSRITKVRNV